MDRYFKVKSGPVHKLLAEHMEEVSKARKAATDFVKEVGAVTLYTDHTFEFKSPPGRGWRRLRDGRWAPDMRLKAGKALAARVKALSQVKSPIALMLKLAEICKGQMPHGRFTCPGVKMKRNGEIYLTATDVVIPGSEVIGCQEITCTEYKNA